MKSNFNYHGDVVVFDLDDTLFRERDYVRSGFRLIERLLADIISAGAVNGEICPEPGNKISAAGLAESMEKILSGRGKYFDFLEEKIASCGLPPEYTSELIAAYRSHIPDSLSYCDGAAEILDILSRRGVMTGLVTDGRSNTQRAKIAALRLDRYITPDNVMISGETGKDKTRPDNFRHFVSLYPEARRFFYIADNERKDFMIPNLLGWTTIRVPYNPDNVHEDFHSDDKMLQPAHILTSLSEFIELFQPKGE